MPKIIDAHSHLFPDFTTFSEHERACEELGIVKTCLMGLEIPGLEMSRNDAIRKAIAARPDLVVGFGGINLWEEVDPFRVNRLRDEGFRGLKFILPPVSYHDPRYYPYYERAAQLRMPICFHLGVIARHPDISCRVDNNLMRAVYLDTIAREFPDIIIWGAHLGNPWYEEAAMCCRWNPNLFFDLSGSTLKCKRPEFLGDLLWWTSDTFYKSPDCEPAWRKILFGSDVVAGMIHDVLNDYRLLITALGLEAFENDIFYENAAGTLRKAGEEC
ncbi:MAG: amidohydrolase family protein [Candidatus Latescibacterota bacterium]